MARRAHARRRSQGFVPATVGGVAGIGVALTLLPSPVGFSTIADAAPVGAVSIEAAPAPLTTSPGAPAEVLPPVPSLVVTGRPVAPPRSPCTVKATQAKAVTAELRTAYGKPTATQLAEDAGIIAQALLTECGWLR